MSSNLTWEPSYRKTGALPHELKLILRKKYGGTVDTDMDETDQQYLQALVDAEVPGAQTLMDAIEKHSRIHVREEF